MRTIRLRNAAICLAFGASAVLFFAAIKLHVIGWTIQDPHRRFISKPAVLSTRNSVRPTLVKKVVSSTPRSSYSSSASDTLTVISDPVKTSQTVDAGKLQGTLAKDQQVCRFPDLPLDSPSLRQFFKDPEPLQCSKVEKNWVLVKNGTFFIDPEAQKRHGGEISCDYTSFWRISDNKVGSSTEKAFKSNSKLKTDFFKVQCLSKTDNATYENVHAGVVPSEDVLKRAQDKKLPKDALGLNVYMLGFDTISRLQFIRKLPKLYKYLTETMDAVVLEGYNIVGDGTPQALIPILTGKTEVELPLTRKRFPDANYVNVYPFVWNEYRDAGYATLYGEDSASVGTFTYRLKGFKEQPTDHYMRTFYSVAEPETNKHVVNCWGSEPHHKVHFDYAEQFWDAYPSIRKFAFHFHSYYSHGNLNQIAVADEGMVQHMKFFADNGHMNNTIIIFMADHGPRFEAIRETQQGKFEERLPFFSFAFPPWFKEKYPDAMRVFRQNAHRLTTPFDIHATLQSILHFDPRPKIGDLTKRELSLFDEIPPERTCADAGIEVHWCTCLDWKVVPVNDSVVQLLAEELVTKINNETAYERKSCAELKLQKIDKASKYVPASAVLNFKKSKDLDGFVADLSAQSNVEIEYYQLDLWTTPGNAHYEASASWDRVRKEMNVDLKMVSHVNKYGDLPHCVIDRDYFLAKWCVCYDKI